MRGDGKVGHRSAVRRIAGELARAALAGLAQLGDRAERLGAEGGKSAAGAPGCEGHLGTGSRVVAGARAAPDPELAAPKRARGDPGACAVGEAEFWRAGLPSAVAALDELRLAARAD